MAQGPLSRNRTAMMMHTSSTEPRPAGITSCPTQFYHPGGTREGPWLLWPLLKQTCMTKKHPAWLIAIPTPRNFQTQHSDHNFMLSCSPCRLWWPKAGAQPGGRLQAVGKWPCLEKMNSDGQGGWGGGNHAFWWLRTTHQYKAKICSVILLQRPKDFQSRAEKAWFVLSIFLYFIPSLPCKVQLSTRNMSEETGGSKRE